MAKGKGVSSRANLIISVKIPVGNAVSSSHQAKAVSSGQTLKLKKKKSNKRKMKAIKDLEKMHPWRVQLASYKGTHRQHLPLVLL
jgi:hypothetical protein